MRKNEVKSKCKMNKIDVTDDTFISQTSVLTGWQKRDVVIRKVFKQGGNLLN